jgi:hypothetical protein
MALYQQRGLDCEARACDPTTYKGYPEKPIVYHEMFDLWHLLECPRYEPCTECGERPTHCGCLVIAVDGACRNNGTEVAQGAYAAVFHEHNTKYNSSSLLHEQNPTNQHAELSAGLLALQLANSLKDLNDPRRKSERLTQDEDGPEALLDQVIINPTPNIWLRV